MVYQVKDGELTIRKVDNLTSFGKAMNDQRVEAEDEYGTKLEFLKHKRRIHQPHSTNDSMGSKTNSQQIPQRTNTSQKKYLKQSKDIQ